MGSCIYCRRQEPEVAFRSREHVIPQFLGTFTPLNPVLSGIVCDSCNGYFSGLEANFKEDSEEGIYGQMLNIEGHSSVRLRGKNVKLKFETGFSDDFFDNIFPFLRKDDQNGFVIDVRPQIHLKNYDGVFQIFLPEALERIKGRPSEFARVKDRLARLSKKDMRIFATTDDEKDDTEVRRIISLLKDFGVEYKEKDSKYGSADEIKGTKFEVEMECKVTQDLFRVLTKIAFNYFAYCALQDNKAATLLDPAFDRVRDFIVGKIEMVPIKDLIVSVDKDVILDIERREGRRVIGHVIVFEEKAGHLILRQTFWGKRVYEMNLGEIPSTIDRLNFGCGHVFNPFEKEIVNLSVQPKENMTEADLRASFGLNKRIRS